MQNCVLYYYTNNAKNTYNLFFFLIYLVLAPAGCTVKHMKVDLNMGIEGIGLVIRGGWNKSSLLIRPLTVMHIRKKSVADL